MKKLFFLVAVLGIAALPFTNAFAAGPVSIGVEGGIVTTDTDYEAFDNTWVMGVFADFGLPMLNWSVEPFLNYWNWSDKELGVETSASDWTIGGNVKMAIPTPSMVRPFIGAGASAHMLSSEVTGAPEFDYSETKFGFQLGGGTYIDAGESWSFVAQSWYHMVEDFNQWSFRGGVAWSL